LAAFLRLKRQSMACGCEMKSQVLFLLVFLSCLPAKDGENKMFLVSNFVMSQKIAIFAQINI
jgi:hypothetical protein